jgi:nicotinamidase-related amidase
MNRIHCPQADALVVLIDVQPAFMAAIWEPERVVGRCRFLLEAAHALEVPVLATVQNHTRMGGLDESLATLLGQGPIPKMAFSCWGAPEFRNRVEASGKSCVVLVGIETHICVSLTALDLVSNGYQVVVCPDAVSSRSVERHKLGMERMRDSGVAPSHSETLVYEWMGSAEHPKFKDVLNLVKESWQ